MGLTLAAILVGLALIAGALWDAFETVVLPRRVERRLRIAGAFYRLTWRSYSAFAARFADDGRREEYLSYYGPLSLLLLVAVWAMLLIVGFGVLQWSAGSAISAPDGQSDFATDLYFSGTTFFTLGLGDVIPRAAPSRVLTVIEGGTGFGFLALV